MIRTIRAMLIAVVLVSCTASVSTSHQYVYSPVTTRTIVTDEDLDITPSPPPTTAASTILFKAPKTALMTLCTPVAQITLPPLNEYSKTKYATHKDALNVITNHLAELRAMIRGYNAKATQACKPYRVLVD